MIPVALAPQIRIERMLVETTHQNTRIIEEDIFRAVAVMHVEIDDGHPRKAVMLQSVRRSTRHVVEETEAHRTPCFGMVARRPHAAECGIGATAHDGIHRRDTRSGSLKSR